MGRALIIGLGALVAVLAAVTFWVGTSWNAARAAADDREAAVRAAATYGVNLLSLSHRTIDQDIKRILDTSTGQARADYARTESAVKAATLKNKVVQTGVLRGSGLVSMDGRTAEVLIVGDAVIRWGKGKKVSPEERFYRWRMEVTKVGDVWLVSKSELVQ